MLEGRSGHTVSKAADFSAIFVFGGWNGQGSAKTVEYYSMVDEEWRVVQGVQMERWGHQSVSMIL